MFSARYDDDDNDNDNDNGNDVVNIPNQNVVYVSADATVIRLAPGQNPPTPIVDDKKIKSSSGSSKSHKHSSKSGKKKKSRRRDSSSSSTSSSSSSSSSSTSSSSSSTTEDVPRHDNAAAAAAAPNPAPAAAAAAAAAAQPNQQQHPLQCVPMPVWAAMQTAFDMTKKQTGPQVPDLIERGTQMNANMCIFVCGALYFVSALSAALLLFGAIMNGSALIGLLDGPSALVASVGVPLGSVLGYIAVALVVLGSCCLGCMMLAVHSDVTRDGANKVAETFSVVKWITAALLLMGTVSFGVGLWRVLNYFINGGSLVNGGAFTLSIIDMATGVPELFLGLMFGVSGLLVNATHGRTNYEHKRVSLAANVCVALTMLLCVVPLAVVAVRDALLATNVGAAALVFARFDGAEAAAREAIACVFFAMLGLAGVAALRVFLADRVRARISPRVLKWSLGGALFCFLFASIDFIVGAARVDEFVGAKPTSPTSTTSPIVNVGFMLTLGLMSLLSALFCCIVGTMTIRL